MQLKVASVVNHLGRLMPTYEFKCEICDAYGTAQFTVDQTPNMRCPRCAKEMVRVYSAPGLIFKGKGWGGK